MCNTRNVSFPAVGYTLLSHLNRTCQVDSSLSHKNQKIINFYEQKPKQHSRWTNLLKAFLTFFDLLFSSLSQVEVRFWLKFSAYELTWLKSKPRRFFCDA